MTSTSTVEFSFHEKTVHRPAQRIRQIASSSLANYPSELASCALSFDPADRTYFSNLAVERDGRYHGAPGYPGDSVEFFDDNDHRAAHATFRHSCLVYACTEKIRRANNS